MLTTIEQFKREVARASRIFIVTPGKTVDDFTSAAALLLAFEKLGKSAEAAAVQKAPENLSFLPSIKKIQNKVSFGSDFVVSFDVTKMGVESLSYKLDGNKLNVFITPKREGEFTNKDVTLKKTKMGYDLIIAINTPDLTKLGDIFNKNPEMFYNATVVNIDHDPSNEDFGKINIVDIHAASTTQILFSCIKNLSDSQNLFDKEIATLLLTGIISETESFQTHSVTPAVLQTAAELFDQGGDQQNIVRHLFRTKELGTLNLWGQIVANMKQDASNKLVWSTISQKDFEASGTTEKDIESALKELLSSIPNLEVAFVLYESGKDVFGKIYAPRNIDALAIASVFPLAHGDFEIANFTLKDTTLTEAESLATTQIKEKIALA